MIYSDKKILFEKFLSEWGEQFAQIPHILSYMASYPELLSKLDGINLLIQESIDESQLEWIGLIAQLDHPIDTCFFKDYWVAIQNDSYHLFLDLSAENFSIFTTGYFFFEPRRWFKKHYIKDLKSFFIDLDKPDFDLDNYITIMNNECEAAFPAFFREHDKLGFAGKIKLMPVDKDTLFDGNPESTCSLENETLTVEGVNSVIIGLLPDDMNITLLHFDVFENKHENVTEKVKNIKAFSYLVQSAGILYVSSYKIAFDSEKGCYAEFHRNTFTIKHVDKLLLEDIIEKFESIKKS